MSFSSEMSDYQIISLSLRMWRNHIETGNVNMSVQDAINCGQDECIKKLEPGQIEFIERLSRLSSRSLEIESQKRLQQYSK